jgi:uncharacterized protein with HEPN domain
MTIGSVERLEHIKERIGLIRALLQGKTLDDFQRSDTMRAAFERFVEIISEASRHLPDQWKTPEIPWHAVAAIGNVLRHAYQLSDPKRLWSIYEMDLDPLEQTVDSLLLEHRTKPAGSDPSPRG